jgi:putative hydrolase
MLKIDLHLHTITSLHAYNTIYEYILHAKKLKMKVIGIADHGPDLDTTLTDDIYFRLLKKIPKYVEGIRVLKGVEANIINSKGELDISEKAIKNLDYITANLHKGTSYKDGGKEKNTQTIINAIKSGKINIISHPEDIKIGDADHARIYEAACKNDVILEINLSHLSPGEFNSDTIEKYKAIVDVAKKYNQKVIVGSDAHCIWEMADDSQLKKIQKQIGLNEKRIINNYPKELFKLLKIDE